MKEFSTNHTLFKGIFSDGGGWVRLEVDVVTFDCHLLIAFHMVHSVFSGEHFESQVDDWEETG